MDSPKPVGIWIRVSTEEQAESDSPELHEERARALAFSKGWEVKEVYDLSGVSGKSVKDHPEAKRMLKDIRKGRIEALLFSKLARLARNTQELLEFADYFQTHKAALVSIQEAIDTSTPAGRLFYTIIAAMAQWEREEISDRVQVAAVTRAKLGKPVNGKAPFGYHWVDRKLVPHPEHGPIRKEIYSLFKEHRRLRTVARLLNDKGYQTQNKAKFSDTTVRRLIEDTTAKGIHISNYSKRTGDKSPWELKPEEEWCRNEVEPLVSDALWQECNDILKENTKPQKRRGRKSVHLFSGVTTCRCGKKMYVPVNSPKYLCTDCKTKVPVVDLEDVFVERMKQFFLTGTELAEAVKASNENIRMKEEKLEAHER